MGTDVFQNFSGRNRGRGGQQQRQRRESGFGQSVLLRLSSVDEESNTLSGTVVGGLRNGEAVEGVSFTGATKPKHLLKKGTQNFIEPELIEAGNMHMIVDGLKKEGDKVTARWMRRAGPHVEFSTPDHQKWMAVVPMKTPWAADDDEPEVPRYGVMTADVGAGVASRSLDEFRDAFVKAASLRNGFGSTHMVMYGKAGRRTKMEYPPTGAEQGKPGATPEARFDALVESLGGEEAVKDSFGQGYAITVTPLSMRTLSKFETTRLLDSDNRMAFFTPSSHGRRLAGALSRAKDAEREKVEQNFMAWAEKKTYHADSLATAEDRVVERFAREHGVKLQRVGNVGFLPAGFALRAEDEEGRPPALVTKLVTTASPVPAHFMPVIGDEKAVERYYDIYRDAAKVLLAAPGLEAAVDAAAAERLAEAEAAEEAEMEDQLAEFTSMLATADFDPEAEANAADGEEEPPRPEM